MFFCLFFFLRRKVPHNNQAFNCHDCYAIQPSYCHNIMFKVSLDPLISFSRSANLIRAPTFSSEKNYLAKRVKCPIYGLYEILLQTPPTPPKKITM